MENHIIQRPQTISFVINTSKDEVDIVNNIMNNVMRIANATQARENDDFNIDDMNFIDYGDQDMPFLSNDDSDCRFFLISVFRVVLDILDILAIHVLMFGLSNSNH